MWIRWIKVENALMLTPSGDSKVRNLQPAGPDCPGVSPYFRSGEIEDGQKFFLDVPYSFIYNRAVSGFTGDSMPEPATISVSRGGGGAAVTFFPDT